MSDAPLTLGTAGHIDHGKTALVRALTGVDTDRLPEERRRGISIELGYAPLRLPGGRQLSVVDVPGHERFVRAMVAGATGIDLFLIVVAADDGVMPQTIEHAEVLRALDITRGVVAVTKSDLLDPRSAAADAAELFAPWADAEVIACSTRNGTGVTDVADALERAASTAVSRAANCGDVVLHVDRSFTIRGAGTVVTGTLWSGPIERGSRLAVLPSGIRVRVRSIEVHGEPVERAAAGQRVALNLVGIRTHEIGRGDVVATPGALSPTHILDARLAIRHTGGSLRATIHHGTRDTPGQLVPLGAGWWQVRVTRPLLARAGDRLVVRSIAPPDTLGGGIVAKPHAPRHGPDSHVAERLAQIVCREPAGDDRSGPTGPVLRKAAPRAPSRLTAAALALEHHLLVAAHEPPTDTALGESVSELPALMAAGLVVRVGRSMYAHVDALKTVRDRVLAILDVEDEITVGRLRDELRTSRKYALALLEYLDSSRVTLRLPDDVRVARKRSRRVDD